MKKINALKILAIIANLIFLAFLLIFSVEGSGFLEEKIYFILFLLFSIVNIIVLISDILGDKNNWVSPKTSSS